MESKVFDFGEAIRMLRDGKRVSRSGWNGKGMFIYLPRDWDEYEPCIVMKTADDKYQPGWLASQADMLADDWMEVTE